MCSLHSPVLADFAPHFCIGGYSIGPGEPCFIIAEAGSNHDRRLDRALALVDIAADAGCNAVKFQTFLGPDIAAGPGTPYTVLPAEFARWGKELQDFYAACSLPKEFYAPIAERARERGILFFSTPFGEWAIDFLVELGVPAFKIASFELVHLPLIRRAAESGLPLIISTGLSGLGDIERALDTAAKAGAKDIALLHCGSNYPLSSAGANLAAMETLRRAFGLPVGYSDHTQGLAVPTAAAVLGANVIEKHFTFGPGGDGPDHSFALDPQQLAAMVHQIREAEQAIGSPRKRRQIEEEAHVRRGRRSLIAARSLRPGEILTADAVKVVRPGAGLEPLLLDLLLGRPVVRQVEAEHPLTWDDFLQPKA